MEDNTLNNISYPVITKRYKLINNTLNLRATSSNSGLACYACELICSDQFSKCVSKKLQRKWAQINLKKILNESVTFQGSKFWRWEARPKRSDYLYPPDWDDICKAFDAINSYENYFNTKVKILKPRLHLIKNMLKKSIFTSNIAGEDIKINCQNKYAMYIFIASLDEKPNNAEDVFITAVTIRSILKNYSKLDNEFINLLATLMERLVEVAKIGMKKNISFCYLSRCYFSWGLFLLMLLDIGNYFPDYLEIIREIASYYIDENLFSETFPPDIANYLVLDEINYIRILSMRLKKKNKHGYRDFYGGEKLQNQKNLQLMYRHRRLNDYYGSPEWSFILDLYTTCLEEGEIEND